IRFANAVHRALSICLDAMLADGSAAARSECMRRLDPTNGNSAVERTRASLAGRVAPKCIGVSPADVSSPCDPRASSLDAVVSCVLNADSSSVQRMIAAEYRDACAMLPAVGLGAAFPA